MSTDSAVQCRLCNWIGHERLIAPNPFDPTEKISGCPSCLQCTEGFDVLCYLTGCMRAVTCGSFVDGEYRFSCFEHSGFAKRDKS